MKQCYFSRTLLDYVFENCLIFHIAFFSEVSQKCLVKMVNMSLLPYNLIVLGQPVGLDGPISPMGARAEQPGPYSCYMPTTERLWDMVANPSCPQLYGLIMRVTGLCYVYRYTYINYRVNNSVSIRVKLQ